MLAELRSLASLLETQGAAAREIRIRGANPSARALVTAYVAQRVPAPLLCIASDTKEAERLADDVGFFSTRFRLRSEEETLPLRILLFPPGIQKAADYSMVSVAASQERLRVLLALLDPGIPTVVVATIEALRERVPPREVLEGHRVRLSADQEMDRDRLAGFLQEAGYRRVPLVEAPGEFAVRGSLIDLYPLSERRPFRVDFFGDRIETIRPFLPETQRSLEPVEAVTIPPAGPYVAGAVDRQGLRQRVKERADALNLPPRARMEFLEGIERGLPAHTLPLYLSFFYPKLATLLDFTGPGTVLVASDPDRFGRVEDGLEEDARRALERLAEKRKIVPAPEQLFARVSTLWARGDGPRLVFSNLPPQAFPPSKEEGAPPPPVIHLRSEGLPPAAAKAGRGRTLSGYLDSIRTWTLNGSRVFLVSRSELEKARLAHILSEYEVDFLQPEEKVSPWSAPPGLHLVSGSLSRGFSLPSAGLVFLHEEDIFGRKVRKHRVRPTEPAPGIDPHELKPDDPVVHVDFGIGIYRGLKTLNIRGYVNDYLHLEYAGGDKLYLPVDRASRIQKYVGTDDEPPPLDKLGGTAWARTKSRVRESILAMAEELISLYAVRLVRKGHRFSPSDASFEEFEAAFPYEETPDQLRAIEEVIRDMEDERPMDRLVCGDVGFGKTEVAVRAAYKAVMDGKQVAVLVPTTVLAQQHYDSFRRRFEGYPVEIEMVSRFRSPRRQREILEALAAGKVDIVIGTHRLLQKDVVFRDLGLLILDEEHRFGVRQKEGLKKLRSGVDVLTLTATPIPRTLQMALLSLRDLSSIKTPPQDRRAVETYVVPFQEEIVRSAVLRELERKGQVFIVHNQVFDIDLFADKIRKIVPEARVTVAHGQMPERDLERVMREFVEGRHDVLVCTTIIESGLDIPNANTMIVHRADRMGLAQLYQLRGRVGRSERQAYAYLVVPDEDRLTDEARRRLEVLYEFTELGSGFRIARHDLEIRGAGNLLGASQSGHIRSVGYDLYMEMLEKEIRRLKGEAFLEEVDPEIHIELPAHLPRDYIEDSTLRLSFYKRLAKARDHEEVGRIRTELEDRFGPLPPEAESLLELMRIKVQLRRLRVKEARLAEDGLLLAFDPHTPLSVERLLDWAARKPEHLRLFPDDRLLIRLANLGEGQRLAKIEEVLVWLLDLGNEREGVALGGGE